MNHNDHFAIRGQLRICHILGECCEHGHCIDPAEVDKLVAQGKARVATIRDNLIVDGGLGAVSRLLGFGFGFPQVGGIGVADINDLQITTVKLGNSSSPPAPANGDTDVSATAYTSTALSIYYPSDTSVTIASIIPQAESSLDGIGITEEGLFLANGAMVARVTFPAEVKVPTHALQFEHTITVTRP